MEVDSISKRHASLTTDIQETDDDSFHNTTNNQAFQMVVRQPIVSVQTGAESQIRDIFRDKLRKGASEQ